MRWGFDRWRGLAAETWPVLILTGVLGALAAAAFSATAALAQLLGESEFSVLFHEGVKESMHVSTVDEQTILLAIFDERTTVGMVRVFAREATSAIGAILAGTRNGRRGAT